MALTRRRLLQGSAGLLAAAALPWPVRAGAVVRRKRFHALGTTVRFTAVHEDGRRAGAAAAEAARAVFAVHEAFTHFEPSPLTRVNELGHAEPVVVPRLVFDLLVRCRALHEETGGLFDITVGGLMDWRRRVSRGETPTLPAAAEAVAGVGMRHLRLDPETRSVRLGHPSTRLDLGGVAKGFAVDKAIAAFRARGVENVLVDAGGDIYAAGRPAPERSGWDVDVAAGPEARLRSLTLSNRAVATSGNYHQPAPHLIDPRDSVAPLRVASATALADDTATADAWATAAFVGEPGRVLSLARRQPGLDVILVLSDGSVLDSAGE